MSKTIPDIRFYDFNFKQLHIENEFLSSSWTIYYNDIGTFEAHFDLKSDSLPVVLDNDYLAVVQGNLSAIIVGKRLGDELIIYGRTCNWLLTKRITDAFTTQTGTADALINAKVKDAFSDCNLHIANTDSTLPTITTSRDDKCETFSFVKESLQLENLGHKLEFDSVNSRWVFEILKGNENNPLVISTVNRNAYDVSMESDLLKLCTEGWYKRQQLNNGESNVIWEMVSAAPLKEGILRWESILSASSKNEALASIYNTQNTDKIKLKTIGVHFGSEEEYQRNECDYSLGDIVSVEWQSGNYKKRARKRIIGVNLWYESENIGEEPIFEDIKE